MTVDRQTDRQTNVKYELGFLFKIQSVVSLAIMVAYRNKKCVFVPNIMKGSRDR